MNKFGLDCSALPAERVQRTIGRTQAWIVYQVDDAVRFHLSL